MLYETLKRTVAPTGRLILRPVVEGLDNLPASGPVIVASNHLSLADPFVIPVVVPRRVTFLAKAEYFEGSGVSGAFLRWLFSALDQIPVQRGGQRGAKAALDTALQVLENGDAFGIYPEGTRSPDGRMYRGHTGVGWLALTSGAPVVPVGLIGTDRIIPIGKRLPRLHRPTMRFGAPLDFSHYAGEASSPQARRAVTDEITRAILELSGQEYAGVYNERAAV